MATTMKFIVFVATLGKGDPAPGCAAWFFLSGEATLYAAGHLRFLAGGGGGGVHEHCAPLLSFQAFKALTL
jgi:hypothetical protein